MYIPKMGKVVKSVPKTRGVDIPKDRKAETGMPGTSWGGIPRGRKAVKSMPKMVYAIDPSVAFENRL